MFHNKLKNLEKLLLLLNEKLLQEDKKKPNIHFNYYSEVLTLFSSLSLYSNLFLIDSSLVSIWSSIDMSLKSCSFINSDILINSWFGFKKSPSWFNEFKWYDSICYESLINQLSWFKSNLNILNISFVSSLMLNF